MQEYDLSHVNKQIQKDTVDAQYARQKAEEHRNRATQIHQEGNPNGAKYQEQEAERFDLKVSELENEIDQLKGVKQRLEIRLSTLEKERANVDRTHTECLAQIDQEITDVRGSGMML